MCRRRWSRCSAGRKPEGRRRYPTSGARYHSYCACGAWERVLPFFVMTMTDTSPGARAKHDDILRAMSGEQRMTLAYEMSMFARDLAREGIRRDHPEWTESQIARELLRLAFFPAPLPAWLERALKTSCGE